MTKTKFLTLIGIVLILLTAFTVYWFYFSKPEPFLTNEQLVKEMNRFSPGTDASVIQDSVYFDEQHVYVPFVSVDNKYGFSFWEWQHHKWQTVLISTNSDMRIWKIKSKDPSTYHLVWNFPSLDQVSYIKLYLIKKRGYHITGNSHYYEPGVQMEKKIPFSENPYGSMQIPTDWISVILSLNSFSANQSDLFSNFFNYRRDIYFGWNAYDKLDNITSLGGSSGSSWYGDLDVDNVMFIDESELEYP
ncbi:hypothetical protein [Psychrobacillus sp. L3]|uniref:hypothetical protein n=1 Tax=Psychrobacillus sp. L3 TaxID=3236891 RepID=UPI0036F20CD8